MSADLMHPGHNNVLEQAAKLRPGTVGFPTAWAIARPERLAATNTSPCLARHALRLLLAPIEPFVIETDRRAARGMPIGSHLAHPAIDISNTATHTEAEVEDLQSIMCESRHGQATATVVQFLCARDAADACNRFTASLPRLSLAARPNDIGLTNAEARRSIAESVNIKRMGIKPWPLPWCASTRCRR